MKLILIITVLLCAAGCGFSAYQISVGSMPLFNYIFFALNLTLWVVNMGNILTSQKSEAAEYQRLKAKFEGK